MNKKRKKLCIYLLGYRISWKYVPVMCCIVAECNDLCNLGLYAGA